jgi:hypothetical protein
VPAFVSLCCRQSLSLRYLFRTALDLKPKPSNGHPSLLRTLHRLRCPPPREVFGHRAVRLSWRSPILRNLRIDLPKRLAALERLAVNFLSTSRQWRRPANRAATIRPSPRQLLVSMIVLSKMKRAGILRPTYAGSPNSGLRGLATIRNDPHTASAQPNGGGLRTVRISETS